MCSTVGVFSTVGGYHDKCGDILSTVGVFSTVGDILSTVGAYLEYRGGYNDARGGYHEYREGYYDTCGGYHEYRGVVQYRGGYSNNKRFPPPLQMFPITNKSENHWCKGGFPLFAETTRSELASTR